MSFLHAALLPFAALAAVPILLHLLTLHRLRTIELPTFRFLFDSYIQQRRRMKFLEALLAALRAAFLLLLVLAFARPVAKNWSKLFPVGGGGRDIVMLVDGSASMNAAAGGRTALTQAKSVANSLVEGLSRDDRVTLIRVAARPEELTSRQSADPKALKGRIDALKAGPTRANFFAALAYVFDPAARRFVDPTVYVFTDGQAGGWREVRDQGSGTLVPKGSRLVLVDVGPREPLPNRAVVGDPPGRQRAIVGLPFTLRPRIVNDAKGVGGEATLSVILDEKEIARVPLALKPGETLAKRVVITPEEPGSHRGRFEISGRTPDAFPDDDSYLFTLQVDPPVPVVLVNGNPSDDPFENGALYVRTALSAGAEDPSKIPAAGEKPIDAAAASLQALRKSLELREIREGELNPEAIRDAGVVILANCGGLNGQHFTWLREFVAGGGGLIILPGDRVNPDQYDRELFTVPGPQGDRVTAAKLTAPKGELEKPETFERLAAIDFAHPALGVFDDPDGRYLRTAHVARRFPIELPAKGANAWPLARFTDGSPAMVESRFGDGTVIVWAFPADAKWTNLPMKPEFVPLILRLTAYVKHRAEFEAPSVVPPEGTAEIAVAASWAPATGKVTDAQGKASALQFTRSNSRLVGPFEGSGERGYYNVEVKGTGGDTAKSAAGAFAVNLDPSESRFARIDPGALREALPGVELTVVDASAEARQAQGKIGEEREVWRPMVLGLFAIIGVEFLLATLGGQRRRRSAGEDEDEAGRVFAAPVRGTVAPVATTTG